MFGQMHFEFDVSWFLLLLMPDKIAQRKKMLMQIYL